MIKSFNNHESFEHFLTKCLIYKILVDKRHKVDMEVKLPEGIIDVVDLTDRVLYEVETNHTKEKNKKDMSKLTLDWKEIKVIHALHLGSNFKKEINNLIKKL